MTETKQQGGFTWHDVEGPRAYRSATMPPSKTDVWETPGWLFRLLDREFNFTVDVAALPENAKCTRFYTKANNGLEQDWRGERVWCNPPFDSKSLTAFVGKGARAVADDPTTVAVFVVPVKADQIWWHEFALRAEVRFIRGRVEFGGGDHAAPMPVCVLVFGVDYPPRMISLHQPQRRLFTGEENNDP